MAALVAEGFGVCLLPRIVPLPGYPVTRVPLRGEPSPARRFVTAVRRGSSGHPVVAACLTALRTAASAVEHDEFPSG